MPASNVTASNRNTCEQTFSAASEFYLNGAADLQTIVLFFIVPPYVAAVHRQLERFKTACNLETSMC